MWIDDIASLFLLGGRLSLVYMKVDYVVYNVLSVSRDS